MAMTTISVAVGGALGAVLRYLLGLATAKVNLAGMPVGVLTANVVGSFVMGLCAGYLMLRGGQAPLQPFVMVGVLGGFTTFSSFSLEAVTLLERGQVLQGVGYIAGSVGLSIAALCAGLILIRGLA